MRIVLRNSFAFPLWLRVFSENTDVCLDSHPQAMLQKVCEIWAGKRVIIRPGNITRNYLDGLTVRGYK